MSKERLQRLVPACCVAVALAVSIGQVVAFAGPARKTATSDKTTMMERAGANSPRFTPARPENVEEFATRPELKSVFFEFDKSQIPADAAAALDENAHWLKDNPFQEIVIAAYADQRGTSQYNFGLAERRARSLRAELVARGVRADRIVLASYGLGLPVCSDKTEECWQKNRRADVMVRRNGPQVP